MTQSVSVASPITPTSVTVIAIIVLILGLPMVVKPQLEIIMSKQRKIKRRKRKSGYVNLTPPNKLNNHTFFSFAEFAKWENNA